MYSIENIVSYSKLDKNGNLPLYEILNFMQDCSTFQSESIGMGIEHLEQSHKAWILISYKIRIKKKTHLGQRIRIGTAPTEFSSIYGRRNFVVESLDGEVLVEADSLWVMIDTQTRRVRKVTDDEKKGYVLEPGIEGLKAERKMKFSSDREKLAPFKVLRTYIDSNGHMNNADYLRAAVEYIPENLKYSEADILYNKEAVEGEDIIPYRHIENDSVELTFEDTQGNILTKIRFNY